MQQSAQLSAQQSVLLLDCQSLVMVLVMVHDQQLISNCKLLAYIQGPVPVSDTMVQCKTKTLHCLPSQHQTACQPLCAWRHCSTMLACKEQAYGVLHIQFVPHDVTITGCTSFYTAQFS